MNEDGEFELVLGNKQLFSVFFIVVVLLGVCFLMGYVVGKNSAPVLNAAIAPAGDREPLVIPTATEPPVTKAKEPAAVEAPVAAKRTAPQAPPNALTEKEAQVASAPPPQAEAVKPAAPPPPAPEKQAKTVLPAFQPEKAAKSNSKQAPIGSQPLPGRVYLQLSATDRDSAEGMADLLRSKSFSAIAAQIPERPELYRVLVGPLNEGDIAKTRTNLKASSFPADEAVRRVF
jgi:hypothetical protein